MFRRLSGPGTVLASLMIASVTLSPAPALANGMTPAIAKGNITIDLQPICEGLTSPVFATHAGDRSDRLFIVDQIGVIWILDVDEGECLADPFLDIQDRLPALSEGFDERGLLGLAFHPRFKRNGRFFVRYSAPRDGSEGEPCVGTSRGCHESIVAEFRVKRRKANKVSPATERVIFRIDQPQFNHNSGSIAFGPDGLLYFALGDGGGAHDGLAEDPPLHGPIGHGQNIETLLGSMLRIDVDRRPDPGLAYRIPRSNPFAGATRGAGEIYAYGFRNPYRFSFDRHSFKRRGDRRSRHGRRANRRDRSRLFVSDVGQNLYEEVNIVEKGGNYGWVTAEGFHCFDPFAPEIPPGDCSGTGPDGEPLLNPIAEYNHGDGIAVVGGFVYRGRESDTLFGKYVFGDFSRSFRPAEGRLFWLDADGTPTDIFEFRTEQADVMVGRYLLGFGEDEDGELYVLTSKNLAPMGSAGEVFRIVDPDADGDDD
ncbi:MAG: PQQ-dependent sugar dehydrogenase [Gammaproteobacteria bacterium]